jgi:hypothetical protein
LQFCAKNVFDRLLRRAGHEQVERGGGDERGRGGRRGGGRWGSCGRGGGEGVREEGYGLDVYGETRGGGDGGEAEALFFEGGDLGLYCFPARHVFLHNTYVSTIIANNVIR